MHNFIQCMHGHTLPCHCEQKPEADPSARLALLQGIWPAKSSLGRPQIWPGMGVSACSRPARVPYRGRSNPRDRRSAFVASPARTRNVVLRAGRTTRAYRERDWLPANREEKVKHDRCGHVRVIPGVIYCTGTRCLYLRGSELSVPTKGKKRPDAVEILAYNIVKAKLAMATVPIEGICILAEKHELPGGDSDFKSVAEWLTACREADEADGRQP